LLRADMFDVAASQDQAFSSFQRQVKMSRRGAAGARHKMSSLLRAEMFERQICQDGCGVLVSQHRAFSSFQRQVKMSRQGAAGARHKMSSLLRAEMFDRQIGPGGLSRRVLCVGKPRSSVFEFPEASQDVETGCRGRTSQDV